VILTNYHTHSRFCDGNSEPEDYVTAALKNKFICLGFSSHAPLPFENSWSLVSGNVDSYCQAISVLKNNYFDEIEIYLSLEIDYIPGVSLPFAQLQKERSLDYVLGAVHLVKNPEGNNLWFIDGPVNNYDKGLKEIFNNDIRYAVKTYYNQLQQMLLSQKPDMVAHFDKVKMNNHHRYFQENESWYIKLVDETLDVISACKTIVEVNTRGIYTGKSESLYPGTWVLQKCYDMNIPLTISSDAHKPGDINRYFTETGNILKEIGYKSIKILKGNKWIDWEI
jgi:histidinol-phosphatase (PHP family)